MSLDRVNWEANQRVEKQDLNDGQELGFATLAKIINRFVAPQKGRVFRGGRVRQTTTASADVVVEPFGGLSAAGELAVLESAATLSVQANNNANPRIDVVSAGYGELLGGSASRLFWNPSTQASFAQATNTRRSGSATVTITAGVPSVAPVAPALPAGHFALAYILVPASWVPASNVITDADITQANPDSGGLHLSRWDRTGGAAVFSPGVDEVVIAPNLVTGLETPEGMATLIGVNQQLGLKTALTQAGASTTGARDHLIIYIEDVASGAVVGRSVATFASAFTGSQPAVPYIGHYFTIGVVTGPTSGKRDYRCRLRRYNSLANNYIQEVVIQDVIDGDNRAPTSAPFAGNTVFALTL